MVIHYWDFSKEIWIEFDGKKSLTISNGNLEVEYDDVNAYYASSVSFFLDTYDLCASIALWQECYGKE